MNAVTQTSKPTRLDSFRSEVLPPDRRNELFAGMPPHVRPERFERNLVNALMQTPELMDCDPRLVYREVSKAAALGLYLDPQLGEAYLIIGWNGKAKRKEPQLRIGYRGLIKLARQSGEISIIYAHEVHESDLFECSLGDHKSLVHKPDIFGDRGAIVGYYSVVKYDNGETDFEPMTVAQVHEIRDRSDGWKAFSAGKIKSTPWGTDEVEMSKKTVIRRLTKRIPQSPELAEAIRIEDAAEHSEMRDITPPRPPAPPIPPEPPRESIEAPTPPAPPSDIEEAEVEDASIDQAEDLQREREAGELDFGRWFEEFESAMDAAATAEEVAEVWNNCDPLATFEGDDDSQALAQSIKRNAMLRIRGNQ